MQKEAQDERIETEKARGTADMQAELAKSQVGIEIKTNNARARESEGRGEASYIEQTGKAQGAQVEAVGMARAKAYRAQVEALGQTSTALVNVATVLSDGKAKFMPDVLVTGSGGSIDGLAAALMKFFNTQYGQKAAVQNEPVREEKQKR
jgi:hypothetical protein